MMESLFLVLGSLALGFIVGALWVWMRAMRTISEELLDQMHSTAEPQYQVKITNSNGQYYVNGVLLFHDVVDNIHLFYREGPNNARTFVCQGVTLDDAAASFQQRDSAVAVFNNMLTNKQGAFMNGKYYE